MRDKKGTELSMNTIVMVVLVLLILFIAMFLLLKGFGGARNNNSCIAHNGVCKALGEPCPNNAPIPASFECPDKNQPKCCTNIGVLGDATQP